MNTNNINNKNNVLPELKSSNSFYPIMGLTILIMISLFMILFFKKNAKSKEETVSHIFLILFSCLMVIGICLLIIPNFKDVKQLFQQISSVTYIIIYTIFLILFFTFIPKDIINKYSFVITPVTILFAAFMFYKSLNTNYLAEFNVNYERIKMMILFFCLISICSIYYTNDPGGYITKYLGFSSLITIIISVFAFLYLIITLTSDSKSTNLSDNFSKLSFYGSIAFFIFIIISIVLILKYQKNTNYTKETNASIMILLLTFCILSGILFIANTFTGTSTNIPVNSNLGLFKRSLLALFGIVISGLLIFWIVYNIQNLSGSSSIVRFVFNLLIVLIVLGFIYKTINVKMPVGNSNKNAFFSLIANTLFYIPCLSNKGFDYLGKLATGSYSSETTGSLLMILVLVILIYVYFNTPSVFNLLNVQGGEQLVNKPVYTNAMYSLGNYQELNGDNKPDYQYAISFWCFIDAAPPNTNSSYSKFTSLLNFANKPNILYNGTTNTLMITTDQKNLKEITKNKLIDFDDNGNRIIYKNTEFLLQKWNNLIINYNGGVLDVFLNGELVKSDIGVVPYMTFDNLTIGEDDGLKGGICNVIYFKRPLNTSNIYYLYNMVKGKSPPVLNDSNKTIMKQHISTIGSSSKKVI